MPHTRLNAVINTDAPQTLDHLNNPSDRVKGLVHRFAKDWLIAPIVSTSEGQHLMGEWIKDWAFSRITNKSALRNDLKQFRKFAQDNQLTILEAHVENLLLETRNNVPNKQTNYNLSHLITQETFKRVLAYEEAHPTTEFQQYAIQMFVVSCMTGLRTSEWNDVELFLHPHEALDGEDRPLPYLKVMTAKTRKEIVEPRFLILDEFNAGQIKLLQDVIAYIQGAPKGVKSNLVIQARRMLQLAYQDDSEAVALLADLDFRTARKIYTCEMRRGGASAKETAAALGHTTIVNLRYYAQGDIACDRKTTLPLARPPKGAIEKVKDTLAELNEKRLAAGKPGLTGYANPDDARGETFENEPPTKGQRFLDSLS